MLFQSVVCRLLSPIICLGHPDIITLCEFLNDHNWTASMSSLRANADELLVRILRGVSVCVTVRASPETHCL